MTKIEKSFWLLHPRIAKKVQNIKAKPEVYISIDDENFPYKGVKGKGTVTIIEDPKNGSTWRENRYEVSWNT